jgi:hypothetical protein
MRHVVSTGEIKIRTEFQSTNLNGRDKLGKIRIEKMTKLKWMLVLFMFPFLVVKNKDKEGEF